MKVKYLILSATLLSAPALAQQTKETTTPTAPPVVKKRTPSLTMEGPGQQYAAPADAAREARWAALIDGMKALDVQFDAEEQRRLEDDNEANRLMDSRLRHHKAPRRASPFRLKH